MSIIWISGYIAEQIAEMLRYAGQESISMERVNEIFQEKAEAFRSADEIV